MLLDALARRTSLSVIAPLVALIILILTSSLFNLVKEDLTASALPVESALMMILMFFFSPSFANAYKSSKEAALLLSSGSPGVYDGAIAQFKAYMSYAGIEVAGIITANGSENKSINKLAEIRAFAESL